MKKTILKLFIYLVIGCLGCYFIYNNFKYTPKDSTIDCEFTRTYLVLSIYYENNNTYLTLRSKNGDIETINLKNNNKYSFDEGRYYEFTFKRNGLSLDDDIKSIFSNTSITNISISDKDYNSQINENICA